MLTDNDFGFAARGLLGSEKTSTTPLTTVIREKFDVDYPQYKHSLYDSRTRPSSIKMDKRFMDVDVADPRGIYPSPSHLLQVRTKQILPIGNMPLFEFKDRVPALGQRAAALIQKRRGYQTHDFRRRFADFLFASGQEAINPKPLKNLLVEEDAHPTPLNRADFSEPSLDNPEFHTPENNHRA